MEKKFLFHEIPGEKAKNYALSKASRRLLFLVLATNCFFGSTFCGAQPLVLGSDQERNTLTNGFHLYDVDLSGGYSSIKGEGGISSSVGGQGFEGYSMWASVSTGYSRSDVNGNFNLNYTPSFTDIFRYSAHAFDQNLTLAVKRILGPRWSYRISGEARENTIENFLFLPTGSGTSESAYLYNPTLTSPAQSLLFGTRVLTLGAGVGLTYSPSDRFHVSIDARGDQLQTRPSDSEPSQYVLPRTRLEQGNADLGYKISPRTEIGAQGYFLATESVVGHDRAEGGSFYLARKAGRHLTLTGQGGVADVSSLGVGKLATTITYTAGASVLYAMQQNSFLVSYHRNPGDTYGLGGLATTTYEALWNWRARRRTWGLQASGDRQQEEGGAIGGIDIWSANISVSRSLSHQVALSLGGSYLKETLPSGLALSDTRAYAARLTLSWIPLFRDTVPLTPPTTDRPVQVP